VSRIIKKAAPIIGAVGGTLLAPGIGTALGSTLGAGTTAAIGGAVGGGLGGAASGGGLKGAALGALGGAAFGGAGSLAGASGLSGAGLSGLSGGIQGAGLGLASGDPKNALIGAGLGGLGGYIGAGGGIPGLGNVKGASLDQVTGVTGIQGPTQGSGVLGRLGSLTQSTGSGPMKLGSLLNKGTNVFSYLQSGDDLDDIQRMLAQRSGQAQEQFAPYAQAGQTALGNLQAPSMEALESDPGYQFRLQQGQQALERSLAARGLGQSGAALKAAQEYGQGLAGQTYDNYFNRQSQLANLGYGAASGLGSLYTNLGNVQAAAEIERMNQRNNMLSGLGGLFG
jgi:hypothetical protein